MSLSAKKQEGEKMENSENVNVATLLECLCDIVIGSLNHTLDREGRYIVEVEAVDDEGTSNFQKHNVLFGRA